MATADYHSLTSRAQVHRIRPVAVAALERYDLEPARVRLVAHDYNTTFRVDTVDGRRFALRINVNSVKEQAHLDAELAWLAALAADTDIAVPAPHPTRDGRLRTESWCPVLERSLPVVLMTWLPGRDLEGRLSPESVRALGRTMARLHAHGEEWVPPEGTAFPTHERVLLDQPDRLASDHPDLDDEGREVLAAAHRRAQEALDRAWAAGPVHAIHGDLNPGNAKWFRRRIALFDFDDAVIGPSVLDLAISAYYLRGEHLDAEMFAGYAEERPLPDLAPSDLEALFAARNLILVNDVVTGMFAADRDFMRPYVRNTVRKLRAFLDTGVYRHELPGLEPLNL